MNRYLFCLLVAFGINLHPIISQHKKHHPTPEEKQDKKLLRLANEEYDKLDFLNAYNLYVELSTHDTSNYEIIFRAGHCLFSINKSDTSCLKYFRKSKSRIPESHFFMGRVYLLEGHTDRAIEEFHYFQTINKEKMISSSEVLHWIHTDELAFEEQHRQHDLTVKNMGDKINTTNSEYVPLIWNTDGSLVFTSRRPDSKGGLKDPYGRYYEDIYISKKINNEWDKPKSISDKINTNNHDACVAFSSSGNELIIYRTDAKQTGGDLYITKFDGTDWTEPVILGPEINSEFLEASACFSANGNEIIFSSNRPGGFGGKDLYITHKFMNGKYSLPYNLGPEINTEEEEDAPFIDKFTNELYFSSKGHNTIGEYDIFVSEFNSETNKWLKAESLGIPINSCNDDIYFTKLEGSDVAMFTSRREGGFGDGDLYEVNLSESTQTFLYLTLDVNKISDKKQLNDLRLSLYDIETGKLEGLFKPNKEYMSMVLVGTKNKPYNMVIESSGCEPIINRKLFNGTETEMKIELKEKPNNPANK